MSSKTYKFLQMGRSSPKAKATSNWTSSRVMWFQTLGIWFTERYENDFFFFLILKVRRMHRFILDFTNSHISENWNKIITSLCFKMFFGNSFQKSYLSFRDSTLDPRRYPQDCHTTILEQYFYKKRPSQYFLQSPPSKNCRHFQGGL